MQPKSEALPRDFVRRLRRMLSADDAESALASMHGPRATSFRVNTLRSDVAKTLAELKMEGIEPTPLDWKVDAFTVPPETREALLHSKPVAKHHLYIQNAASMVPVEVLAPEPGERVLDLTAAPGSKTLQMVCRMENEGELAAVEVVKDRFYRMNALLRDQGAEIVRTYLKNGMGVWRHRPDYFDRVLLDAPCSSEGRFHAEEPQTFAYWSPRKIREMERKQRKLLYSAVRSLRPGGTLVYSTCSFSPEENEGVIDSILSQFEGELEVEPLGLDLPNMRPALNEWEDRSFDPRLREHARRIIPDELFEGFFVCRLRKQ